MEDHTWRRCDCSLPGRGTPAVWSQDARSGPQSARGTPATRPGDLSAGPVQGRSWRDNMRRHGCCTSFPRGHLQLSVTSRCCRCLLIGINLQSYTSFSVVAGAAVAHSRVNVPVCRPILFTGQRRNHLRQNLHAY